MSNGSLASRSCRPLVPFAVPFVLPAKKPRLPAALATFHSSPARACDLWLLVVAGLNTVLLAGPTRSLLRSVSNANVAGTATDAAAGHSRLPIIYRLKKMAAKKAPATVSTTKTITKTTRCIRAHMYVYMKWTLSKDGSSCSTCVRHYI